MTDKEKIKFYEDQIRILYSKLRKSEIERKQLIYEKYEKDRQNILKGISK